jgi:hypothetical protein
VDPSEENFGLGENKDFFKIEEGYPVYLGVVIARSIRMREALEFGTR